MPSVPNTKWIQKMGGEICPVCRLCRSFEKEEVCKRCNFDPSFTKEVTFERRLDFMSYGPKLIQLHKDLGCHTCDDEAKHE